MQVYLIGAGVIAKTHAQALRQLPNSESITLHVADPNPQALNQFIDQFPNAVGYRDAREMLSEPASADDIVIICTPPNTHFELSCLALNSGRHVLCEKPLAMNEHEAREMVRIARQQGLLLGCCSDRFTGTTTLDEVKKLLSSGILGEIYKVTYVHRSRRSRPGIEYQPTSRWFLDKSKAGGGILMDWGPYDFAVLNDLFQPTAVEVLGAWTSRPLTHVDPVDTVFDVETHVGALIRYALQDAPPICIQYERASCAHGEEYHHVEIEGTLGSVRWSPYEFGDAQPIILALDRDGQVEEREIPIQNRDKYGVMDRPLCYFYEYLKGLSSLALLNEQAVFNFSCLQAIATCAATQEPQVVKR